jgi:hypothetical protein
MARYLLNKGSGENALLTSQSDYLLSKARQSISAGAQALEDSITDIIEANCWKGFPDDQVWDTVTPVTTPTDMKNAYSAYHSTTASHGTFLKIVCDWDGIVEVGTDLFVDGYKASKLIVNSSEPSGYERPDGGVLIVAADGKSPAIDGEVDLIGAHRTEIKGIDFCKDSGTDTFSDATSKNIYALLIRSTGTYPSDQVVAINQCNFGMSKSKPEYATNYARWISAIKPTGRILSLSVDGCLFKQSIVSVIANGVYNRLVNNYKVQSTEDFFKNYTLEAVGYHDTHYTRCYALCENNVACDYIDDVTFADYHQDFFQTGTGNDVIDGYSTVVRNNYAHIGSNLSGGSQGFYADDIDNPSSEAVIHNNVLLMSAPHGITIYNTDPTKYTYIERNVITTAGNHQNDSNPKIGANGLAPPDAYVNAYLANNITNAIDDVNFLPENVTNTLFVTHRSFITESGDGLSGSSPKLLEDVLVNGINKIARSETNVLSYDISEGVDINSDRNSIQNFAETLPEYTNLGVSEYNKLITLAWDGNDLTELNVDANADGFTVTDEDGLVVKNV